MLRKELDTNYRFTDKAKKDISDSAVWYEEQQKGVGAEFLSEVKEKATKIAARPNSYGKIFGDIRRASLIKFPFFIYYIIKEPIVWITAVWHRKRLQNSAYERTGDFEDSP